MTNTGGSKTGMLSTDATHRPSLLRHLAWLYRTDRTFSSILDFAVVGGVVLFFMTFFPSRDTKAPLQPNATASSNQTGTGASQPLNSAKQDTTNPAISRSASSTKTEPTPVTVDMLNDVSIPFPADVIKPSFKNFTIVDIDEAAFRRSSLVDQQKLAAATRAFRSEQFSQAISILNEATSSDPNVAFLHGIALFNADPKAGVAAFDLLRSAANQGQHQALVMQAVMLIRSGDGIAKDVAAGRKILEAAASAGDRMAQRFIGVGNLSGDFGEVDPKKAREVFRAAAQAGDVPAMLFYSLTLGLAVGGPADQAGAADLLRRAGAAGLTSAQEAAGRWLLARYKKKQIDDPREAVEWLEKAAMTGHSLGALEALAAFHGDNSTPTPWLDRKKVFELASLCSGLQNAACHSINGWVFEFGITVKRDLPRALAHYRIANELGFGNARKSITSIEERLSTADKSAADEITKKIKSALKPEPPPWHLQYVGLSPASPWAAAPDAPIATNSPPPPAPVKPSTTVTGTSPLHLLSAAQENALKPKDRFRECDECPEMVVVPAGSFSMGSSDSERAPVISSVQSFGRKLDRDYVQVLATEGPVHAVKFAHPFAVGLFPVTFDQWDSCVAEGGCDNYRPNDQGWGRGQRPVINVNWNDAKSYVAWLSRKAGKEYRLLSEAEREYVARAGTTTRFWFGDTVSLNQANFNGVNVFPATSSENSLKRTSPVDAQSPNPWGLYQTVGNSYDWVEDCFHDNYHDAPSDGTAWMSGTCTDHVVRGGAWTSYPFVLRPTYRGNFPTDRRIFNVGFRVARTLAASAPVTTVQHTTTAMSSAASVVNGPMQFMVNGKSRIAMVHSPTSPGPPPPAIIMLHGAGGPRTIDEHVPGLVQIATRAGLAVVLPEGTAGRWNFAPAGKMSRKDMDFFQQQGGAPDDVEFLGFMIQDLGRRKVLDDHHVYLSGLSLGGVMALRMACSDVGKFAGLGLLISAMPETFGADCRLNKPTPVVMVNATGDQILPYAGGKTARDDILWPTPQMVEFFRSRNGCRTAAQKSTLTASPPIEVEKFVDCSEKREVDFYRIIGGGHQVPLSINAAQLLVDFFRHKAGATPSP